jgi:hypothetical protein
MFLLHEKTEIIHDTFISEKATFVRMAQGAFPALA